MHALTERIGTDIVEPALAALAGEGTPRERIEAFIETWVIAAFSDRDLIRISIRPLANPATSLADERLAHASHAIEAIAKVIEEGVESGEFDTVDPLLAAECLFGLVNTRAAAGAVEAPHDRLIEADAEQVAEFISTLFMEGICPC